MAEGGIPQRSFKDSFRKASGDAEEVFCEPCSNMVKSVAVKGYCQTCQEYLCGNCLKVHKNQKMTKDHTFLDKNQMPGGQGPNTKQDLCVEVCKLHQTEIVRQHCEDHDTPGCGDCMTLKHANCKKVRVQDISDGLQTKIEFKRIHQNLDDCHKEVKVIKDVLDNNLKNLDTTYNDVQHQITSYRKHINDYLDQIQKQITDEAAEMKQTYETQMKKLIAKNKSMKSELEDILQNIQTTTNVNSIFVITKQAKQKLGKMKKEITEIKQSQQQQLLQQQHNVFRPSTEIGKLVSTNTPLGKLVRKPNVNTTASYIETIDVKTKKDKGDCYITDCTLLGPDKMVVTDRGNKNIKLIDLSKNTVISGYKTSVPPGGVTAVRTDQVAVTLPDVGRIQLYDVISTFTKQREIQVNKDCQGIAYKDGKFAVTYRDPDRIEILDIQGQVLHTIQGKEGIRYPSFITFGQDNDTVIVAAGNEVSVVTFKEEIRNAYTNREVVSGIVITPDGVLFVCSLKSTSVHAVSPDFKTSKIIINTEGDPKRISYCDINHRLYILSRHSDSRKNAIKVYDLNV